MRSLRGGRLSSGSRPGPPCPPMALSLACSPKDRGLAPPRARAAHNTWAAFSSFSVRAQALSISGPKGQGAVVGQDQGVVPGQKGLHRPGQLLAARGGIGHGGSRAQAHQGLGQGGEDPTPHRPRSGRWPPADGRGPRPGYPAGRGRPPDAGPAPRWAAPRPSARPSRSTSTRSAPSTTALLRPAGVMRIRPPSRRREKLPSVAAM